MPRLWPTPEALKTSPFSGDKFTLWNKEAIHVPAVFWVYLSKSPLHPTLLPRLTCNRLFKQFPCPLTSCWGQHWGALKGDQKEGREGNWDTHSPGLLAVRLPQINCAPRPKATGWSKDTGPSQSGSLLAGSSYSHPSSSCLGLQTISVLTSPSYSAPSFLNNSFIEPNKNYPNLSDLFPDRLLTYLLAKDFHFPIFQEIMRDVCKDSGVSWTILKSYTRVKTNQNGYNLGPRGLLLVQEMH